MKSSLDSRPDDVRRSVPSLGKHLAPVLLLMPLLVAAAPQASGDVPDFVLFLGRFHPVVLHFPIGLLLLAAFMELLVRYRRAEHLAPAIPLILGLGAASAFVTSIAGLLLSLGEDYEEVLVNRHMWLGFGVAAASTAAFVLKKRLGREQTRSLARGYAAALSLTVLLLVPGSHFGASLTHGSDYLTQYMPRLLGAAFGMETGSRQSGRIEFADVDAANPYADIIRPIFEDRCVSCHNPGKVRGKLLMDTPENLLKGGESGSLFVAGDAESSELVRRLILPESHDDHMPKKRKSLRPEQIALIRWWVDAGAPFDKRVADVETPAEVRALLDTYSVGGSIEPADPLLVDLPPADSMAVQALRASGLIVLPISEESPLLQVATTNVADRFGASELASLAPIADYVAWLDLGRSQITDEGLAILREMPHLQRLHMEYTRVGDTALRHLSAIQGLRYLNLVGTNVTDRGLEPLTGLTQLTNLYLWQTRVTPEGAELLRQSLPELEISLGDRLQWPESVGEAPASATTGF